MLAKSLIEKRSSGLVCPSDNSEPSDRTHGQHTQHSIRMMCVVSAYDTVESRQSHPTAWQCANTEHH